MSGWVISAMWLYVAFLAWRLGEAEDEDEQERRRTEKNRRATR